jgi:hypothetical protein
MAMAMHAVQLQVPIDALQGHSDELVLEQLLELH